MLDQYKHLWLGEYPPFGDGYFVDGNMVSEPENLFKPENPDEPVTVVFVGTCRFGHVYRRLTEEQK